MTFAALLVLLVAHPGVDPLSSAPRAIQEKATCVIHTEDPTKSLVDGDAATGHEGLFQFALWIWTYGRSFVAGEPATPNEANRVQQDRMFYFFYMRNGGLRPEWQEC